MDSRAQFLVSFLAEYSGRIDNEYISHTIDRRNTHLREREDENLFGFHIQAEIFCGLCPIGTRKGDHAPNEEHDWIACPECSSVYYCSESCRATDAHEHSLTCEGIQEIRELATEYILQNPRRSAKYPSPKPVKWIDGGKCGMNYDWFENFYYVRYLAMYAVGQYPHHDLLKEMASHILLVDLEVNEGACASDDFLPLLIDAGMYDEVVKVYHDWRLNHRNRGHLEFMARQRRRICGKRKRREKKWIKDWIEEKKRLFPSPISPEDDFMPNFITDWNKSDMQKLIYLLAFKIAILPRISRRARIGYDNFVTVVKSAPHYSPLPKLMADGVTMDIIKKHCLRPADEQICQMRTIADKIEQLSPGYLKNLVAEEQPVFEDIKNHDLWALSRLNQSRYARTAIEGLIGLRHMGPHFHLELALLLD